MCKVAVSKNYLKHSRTGQNELLKTFLDTQKSFVSILKYICFKKMFLFLNACRSTYIRQAFNFDPIDFVMSLKSHFSSYLSLCDKMSHTKTFVSLKMSISIFTLFNSALNYPLECWIEILLFILHQKLSSQESVT